MLRRCWLAALLCVAAACGSPKTTGQAARQEERPRATLDGGLDRTPDGRAAQGRRLARILGCTDCHGAELRGKPFQHFHASNLTQDVRKYSDLELDRLLRNGKRSDGSDLWSMPSEVFRHLSEPDMAALIGHLRTLRPSGPPTPPPTAIGPELRKAIAEGKVKPAAQWIAETRARTPVDLGPRHSLGRYIAMISCAECHDAALEGYKEETPDLAVVDGYSRDEFEALMTEGIPNGPRKLGLMATVGRMRTSQLTPSERTALYSYLKARARQPQ